MRSNKTVLTIVVVAILALAIGQVQAAESVDVPNGDFQTIVKPGTTIAATIPDGCYFSIPNFNIKGGGPATYADGTTGNDVELPGWVITAYSNGNPDCMQGGGWGGPDGEGDIAFLCFGTWGGPSVIESAAPLSVPPSGSGFTLSADVYFTARPLALELSVDGVALTPDTESSPPGVANEWVEFTRTYSSIPAGDVKIVVGTRDPDGEGWSGTGIRASVDNIKLNYEVRFQATNLIPADEATDVSRNVVLSWIPGIHADRHDVYFGTDFNNVTDATTTVDPNNVYKGRQDPNSYPIADTLDLDFGQTYYWRIDEVNAPPYTNKIFKGDIWQFTVEPFAYPIDGNNITARASSSVVDQRPENTVNRSGLDVNDLHSVELTDMWLSGEELPGQAWIEYEFDKVYKLHQMWVWNHNTTFEVWVGFGLKDVTIKYSTNGTDWTALAGVTEFAQGTGSPDYTHNTPVDFDGVEAKYVKITANSNWTTGQTTQYGLSEVRFLYIPVWARYPNPQDGAAGVGPDVVLSWRAGREATTHEVYLSSSRKDVVDGTASVGSVSEATYDAGTLDLGETYYWKINEVNMAETPTSWKGDVWNFATPEYLVVDDFEDYDIGANQIWFVWKDGIGYSDPTYPPPYPGNNTGSAVGDASTSNFMEQTIFYGGSYSMPFVYNNSGAGGILSYSETFREWSEPQNWIANGVKALVVPFYGDPANTPAPLYVAVEDSMGNIKDVAYNNGDPDAVLVGGWQEFQIPLTDFTGVTLSSVKKLYFGVGNRNFPQVGGTGTLYIDDIGLYPSRCVLSKRSADFAKVDYVADCVVNYKELEVMAENWLVATAAPGTVPNGDFEEVYKPGTMIAGNVSDGGWSQGVGLDCPMDSGTYVFSDGTTGDVADIPGWVGYDRDGWIAGGGTGDRDQTTGNLQGSISTQHNATEGGLQAYLSNGEPWGAPAGGLIVSDASLANVVDGTYTLSMVANGAATPVVLDLLAGGVALTPASAVDPVLTDDWQEFSRTYDSASLAGSIGQPLTIVLGVGRNATGQQTRFDDVTLFHSPQPLPTQMLRLPGRRANLYEDEIIDFKDFAELAVWWLDEQLWP